MVEPPTPTPLLLTPLNILRTHEGRRGGAQGGGWGLRSLLQEVLDDLMSSISFVKLELNGFVPAVIQKKTELTYPCKYIDIQTETLCIVCIVFLIAVYY